MSNRSGALHRYNFFAEFLPGAPHSTLSVEIRVSSDDVIALLTQFDRDVAGTVQIYCGP